MIVLLEALFLAAMMVAAIFAGSDAWSSETSASVTETTSPEPNSAVNPELRASSALTIVIRPAVNLEVSMDEAVPETRELTLAEIVDTATIPAAFRDSVVRHLRSVVLTDLPAVGEERTFTQEGLEAIVGEATRRLEAAGHSVEWKVPARSHVVRKSTYGKESVSKALRHELSERCGGCEVVFRRLAMPNTDGLRVQSWRLVVRTDRPRGSFAVPIELEVANSASTAEEVSRKTMMITGEVELYAEVPVATRAISGTEKISPADFKTERRNVTFALDRTAVPQDLAASVAARSIAFGEPIWKSSLRREQLIKFGDPVRVQIGGDSWSITSDGVAQGNASLGESVRVKVGKSQKLVSGVLKEKGLVEIE